MEKEYKIEWCENKSDDWKVLTLIDGDQTLDNVSVNRVNKEGEVFPNFDGLVPSTTVKANLWTSKAGKRYLFAPKPQGGSNKGVKSQVIEKAMERKETSIGKFQDNKELGIKISATMRDAVLCAIAEHSKPNNIETLESLISKWRKILWFEWDKHTEFPPFN